jgi:hypothetical protein
LDRWLGGLRVSLDTVVKLCSHWELNLDFLVKSSLTLAAVKASDLNFINLYTDT